jgi:hypothetical protein
MAIFRISAKDGAAPEVFHVQAGDPDQARRMVRLNCGVPADDSAQFSCEIDTNASVPYGVIHSPITGTTIAVVRR